MDWKVLLLVVLIVTPTALAAAGGANTTHADPAPTPKPGPWPPPPANATNASAPANATAPAKGAPRGPASGYEPTVASPGVRDWLGFKGDAQRTGGTGARAPASPVRDWEATGTSGYGIAAEPVVAHNLVVFAGLDRKVHAVHGATGFPQWEAEVPGHVLAAPAVAEDVLLVASLDGTLSAFQLATGAPRWNVSVGDHVSGAPLVANGVVYVVGEGGRAWAFEVPTGKARWNRTLGPIHGGVAPMLAGSRLIVGQDDGRVVALQILTGATLWSTDVGAPVTATPLQVAGRVLVPHLGLSALDAETGRVLWKRPADGFIVSSPAFGLGMLVYGDPSEPGVVGADALTGEVKWRAPLQVFVTTPPVAAGDLAIVASKDGTISALRLRNGTAVWQVDAGERMSVAPVVTEGRILAARVDGTVRLFTDASRPEAAAEAETPQGGGGNGFVGLLPIFAAIAAPYFGIKRLRDRMHRQAVEAAKPPEAPAPSVAPAPAQQGALRVGCPQCACRFGIDLQRERVVRCPACRMRFEVRRRAATTPREGE